MLYCKLSIAIIVVLSMGACQRPLPVSGLAQTTFVRELFTVADESPERPSFVNFPSGITKDEYRYNWSEEYKIRNEGKRDTAIYQKLRGEWWVLDVERDQAPGQVYDYRLSDHVGGFGHAIRFPEEGRITMSYFDLSPDTHQATGAGKSRGLASLLIAAKNVIEVSAEASEIVGATGDSDAQDAEANVLAAHEAAHTWQKGMFFEPHVNKGEHIGWLVDSDPRALACLPANSTQTDIHEALFFTWSFVTGDTPGEGDRKTFNGCLQLFTEPADRIKERLTETVDNIVDNDFPQSSGQPLNIMRFITYTQREIQGAVTKSKEWTPSAPLYLVRGWDEDPTWDQGR